jgi:hypothetical protein
MLSLVNHPVKGLLLPNETIFNWIILSLFAMQYFWFFSVFLINKLAEDVFPDDRRDETGLIRSFLHWLMTWPTITAYCLIEVGLLKKF